MTEKDVMHFQVDPTSLSHEKQMDIFMEQTKRIEELHSLVSSLQAENKRLKEERNQLFDQSFEYLTLAKIFQHFFWFSLNAPVKCVEMAESGLAFRSGQYYASKRFVEQFTQANIPMVVKDGMVYVLFVPSALSITQYVFKNGTTEQYCIYLPSSQDIPDELESEKVVFDSFALRSDLMMLQAKLPS